MKLLQSVSVRGKRVLLRLDVDVPISDSHIRDSTRLEKSLASLTYLLERKATVVIVGHVGRPKGETYELRSKNQEESLRPVANWFEKRLRVRDAKSPVAEITLGDFPGWKLTENLFLLENIRFFPEEERNDNAFARQLASIADLYINDAFAVSHRKHASLVAVTAFLPSYAGLHLQQEVRVLSQVMRHPRRPLAVIVGGAKIETKLPLIEKMHKIADIVLVGGKLAGEAAALLKVQHEKAMTHGGRTSKLLIAEVNAEKNDITAVSVENFLQELSDAKTIVWNGPLGKTEIAEGQKGSRALAEAVVRTKAFTVVGGGDTIDAIQRFGLLEKFNFVSTGGGAMLAFLSGETLPAIEVLTG